jgi:hypothetical protein
VCVQTLVERDILEVCVDIDEWYVHVHVYVYAYTLDIDEWYVHVHVYVYGFSHMCI